MARQATPERFTFLDAVPEADLVGFIAECDVVAGIFGGSPKAASVIANKVWQGLSTERWVITRRSPALEEIRDVAGAWLVEVEPESAAAITDALRETAGLRLRGREGGRRAARGLRGPALRQLSRPGGCGVVTVERWASKVYRGLEQLKGERRAGRVDPESAAFAYAGLTANALSLVGLPPARTVAGRVMMVLPELRDGAVYAGIRTCLEVAGVLHRATGRRVVLVLMNGPSGRQGRARAHAIAADISGIASAELSVLPVSEMETQGRAAGDIWVATHWTTAYALSTACAVGDVDASRVIYLIQDYEADFEPASVFPGAGEVDVRSGLRPARQLPPVGHLPGGTRRGGDRSDRSLRAAHRRGGHAPDRQRSGRERQYACSLLRTAEQAPEHVPAGGGGASGVRRREPRPR